MRDYEITLVLNADLEDEARDEIIGRVTGWINSGFEEEVEPTVNHWGRRRLAYPINKQTEGYYVLLESPLETSSIAELERNMRYVDEILRHLVVRKED